MIEIPLWRIYNQLLVPDHYTGGALPVSLTTVQQTTNNVFLSFVSPQPPPRVTALFGCQTSTESPPSLDGCQPGVDVIKVQGHYLYQPFSVFIGGKLCTAYTVAPFIRHRLHLRCATAR